MQVKLPLSWGHGAVWETLPRTDAFPGMTPNPLQYASPA